MRGRDGDEVPAIMSKALLAAGVPRDAISIIPDEQEAIDGALNMGRVGDLVLIFADALVRSWKQIIKFRPEGSAEPASAPAAVAAVVAALEPVFDESSFASLGGLVRDERGIHLSREGED